MLWGEGIILKSRYIYIPREGSCSWNLLINLLKDGPNRTKKELCIKSQRLIREKNFLGDDNGWKDMNLLIYKNIIFKKKWNFNVHYRLTNKGVILGLNLIWEYNRKNKQTNPSESHLNKILKDMKDKNLCINFLNLPKLKVMSLMKKNLNPRLINYNVILVIDNRERFKEDYNYITRCLEKMKIKIEIRQLPVGDFVWIAQDKLDFSKEFIFDVIIERKCIDDLIQSIKDFRYKIQKYKMTIAGFMKIIYLIEGFLYRQDQLNINILKQCIIQTRSYSNFQILKLESLNQSVILIKDITQNLKFDQKQKLTFKYANFFNECKRKLRKTKKIEFGQCLNMIKDVNYKIVNTIIERYPTVNCLLEVFEKESFDILDGLLKELNVGTLYIQIRLFFTNKKSPYYK